MPNKKICPSIFYDLEVEPDGEAFFCCYHRIEKKSLGNIFVKKFDDIWNSKFAQVVREEALKGNYPYCNKKLCHRLNTKNENHLMSVESSFEPYLSQYPVQISFPLDSECNGKCIFCRDKIKTETKQSIENYKEKLINTYLPIIKNSKIITVNDSGDAFFSRFSRYMIKTLIKENPNIKFRIMTNGICATKEIIEELNLCNHIEEFAISINATTEKTHSKIFRTKGFKQLVKNLEYISKLKEEGKIQNLHFNFVVCKYNYKEMVDFVSFAKKHKANIHFWEVKDYYHNTLENKFEDIAVHLESHKDYKKFNKILLNKIFDDDNIILSPIINEIRNKAIKQKENTLINKILKLVR